MKRNKGWRQQILRQKYITRLKLHAVDWWLDRYTKVSSWTQLYNHRYTYNLKTTSTPCSCAMCRGERYSRLQFKKETKRILTETLYE